MFDASGEAVAALAVVAPMGDLPADGYGAVGASVVRVAAALSRELGFVGAEDDEAGAPPASARAA